ncbi:hypothetical protein [uncultured Dokdonia sp.]|uniref:hypothetical protein n=1 Tax=uncultured Dokdonia sp. TaxID=575653 RepID=UPI0030EC1F73|tara:strand:+ start:30008 stop:30670 length:663 start_codon:yes stop_codon:yes gene_type:complete
MNNNSFNSALKAKIGQVFTQFKSQSITAEQLAIAEEGFVFSEVNPQANILVMGINPSLRNDFVSSNGYSYNYDNLNSDRYFKKFSTLLKDFEKFGITYCDLFYQRHTEQKQIEYFLKDEKGRDFLKSQLAITKEVIEHISPELILLFNRKGATFFSQEWIGYTLEQRVPNASHFEKIDDLYNITELETSIYCSSFLGYRTRKETYTRLYNDIELLIKSIA